MIPLKYLDAIGVRLDLLQDLVELDQRGHSAALLVSRYPESFVARLLAAVYRRFPLPDGLDEETAIAVVQDYAIEHGLSCCIKYPGLLTIWVGPDGSVTHQCHEPQVTIAGGRLAICGRGDGIGVTQPRSG